MASSRIEQLLEYRPSCATWIVTVLLSVLTMSIAFAAKHFSSTALGLSVASVTLVVGLLFVLCPIGQCQDWNHHKILWVFIIFYSDLLIIETTGFVVPLTIQAVTAYLLFEETYPLFKSFPDEKLDKGTIVTAAIFSILATLAVAVMALFWCCCTRSSGDWFECRWKSTSRTEAEREQEERQRQEEREEFDRLEEHASLKPQEELEKHRLWLYGDRTELAKGSNVPSYSTIP